MIHHRSWKVVHVILANITHEQPFIIYSNKKPASLLALASIHNIHVMHDICAKMRELII